MWRHITQVEREKENRRKREHVQGIHHTNTYTMTGRPKEKGKYRAEFMIPFMSIGMKEWTDRTGDRPTDARLLSFHYVPPLLNGRKIEKKGARERHFQRSTGEYECVSEWMSECGQWVIYGVRTKAEWLTFSGSPAMAPNRTRFFLFHSNWTHNIHSHFKEEVKNGNHRQHNAKLAS